MTLIYHTAQKRTRAHGRTALSIMLCTTIIAVMLLINIREAHASHPICGFVTDASDGESPIGYTVALYYPSTPATRTTCSVTYYHDENRYCCDLENIDSSWSIGSTVTTEAVFTDRGYYAGPVNTITTGGGYDIAPSMKLRSALNITRPLNNSVYSTNSLELNITTNKTYNQTIWYRMNTSGTWVTLCTNCTSANTIIALPTEGDYKLSVTAFNNSRNISRTLLLSRDAINDPPEITAWQPASLTPTITELDTQRFNATIIDTNPPPVIKRWYQNRALITSATNSTNYTFIAGRHGPNSAGTYNITLEANDGEYEDSITWILTVTNVNYAPNVTRINITSDDYLNRTNSTFTLNFTYNDGDNDSRALQHILWHKDNTIVTAATNHTRIGPYNFTRGSTVIASVRVHDGTEWSNWSNSTPFTIQNSVPQITNHSPSQLLLFDTEGSTIRFFVNATDQDNDSIIILWQADGIFQDTNQTNTSWSFGSGTTGVHTMRVNITDNASDTRQNSITWTIEISPSGTSGSDSTPGGPGGGGGGGSGGGAPSSQNLVLLPGEGLGPILRLRESGDEPETQHFDATKGIPFSFESVHTTRMVNLQTLSITPSCTRNDITITVQRIARLPITEPESHGTPIGYFDVKKDGIEARCIEEARATFLIHKSVFESTSARAQDIQAYRFGEEKEWERLNPSIKDTEEYYEISVSMSKLSYFALYVRTPKDADHEGEITSTPETELPGIIAIPEQWKKAAILTIDVIILLSIAIAIYILIMLAREYKSKATVQAEGKEEKKQEKDLK